jgi:hypothetical protein
MAGWRISLTEENAVSFTGEFRSFSAKGENELRVGQERGWVELHLQPPGRNMGKKPNNDDSKRYVAIVASI